MFWDTVGGELIMLGGFVCAGLLSSFLVWKKWFYEDPNRYKKNSRWDGIKWKTDEQLFKEMAQKNLRETAFGIAEEQFNIFLKLHQEDVEAHLGLADSQFRQVEWGLRKDLGKKEKALKEYQWVIDFYLQHKKLYEAVELYKKILGPYSKEEIGEKYKALIADAAKEVGTLVIHEGEEFTEYRQRLRGEFEKYEKSGMFVQAQSVLEDILKSEVIQEIDPGLLARMGDVCLRNKKDRLVEDIFEQLVRRGDMLQTIRALSVLERFWMHSIRRPHLAQLYKESGERFATIDESHEWLELGKKLKT